MSKSTTFDVQLFSPRWGHDDNYQFNADKNKLIIKCPHDVECKWVENRDPVWSGYGTVSRHPLVSVLLNDHIYPPTVFADAVEWAWIDWRNDEIDDSQFAEEIKTIFNWVDSVTKTRPNSDYWRLKF